MTIQDRVTQAISAIKAMPDFPASYEVHYVKDSGSIIVSNGKTDKYDLAFAVNLFHDTQEAVDLVLEHVAATLPQLRELTDEFID